MLSKKCKAHLSEAKMNPLQHMVHALTIAVRLQLLVPALIIHSVAPRWFATTASDTMKDILK